MLSDAHTHLRGSLEESLGRAKDNAVRIILTAGTNLQSSIQALDIANRYDEVYACAGIHPWRASDFNEETYWALKGLLREPRVVAVSEIGLDFRGRRKPDGEFTAEYLPKEIQFEAFRGQIRLAKEVGRPIIFHNRKADLDLIKILREEGASEVGGAIHGFSGNADLATKFIEMGFLISIGKRGIESKDEALQEAIRRVPLERMLIETDSPEPANVKIVAKEIAKLKGTTMEDVAHKTTSNLKREFKI